MHTTISSYANLCLLLNESALIHLRWLINGETNGMVAAHFLFFIAYSEKAADSQKQVSGRGVDIESIGSST